VIVANEKNFREVVLLARRAKANGAATIDFLIEPAGAALLRQNVRLWGDITGTVVGRIYAPPASDPVHGLPQGAVVEHQIIRASVISILEFVRCNPTLLDHAVS